MDGRQRTILSARPELISRRIGLRRDDFPHVAAHELLAGPAIAVNRRAIRLENPVANRINDHHGYGRVLEYLLVDTLLREQCAALGNQQSGHVDDKHDATHLGILGSVDEPELDRFLHARLRLERHAPDDRPAGRTASFGESPCHVPTQTAWQCLYEQPARRVAERNRGIPDVAADRENLALLVKYGRPRGTVVEERIKSRLHAMKAPLSEHATLGCAPGQQPAQTMEKRQHDDSAHDAPTPK